MNKSKRLVLENNKKYVHPMIVGIVLVTLGVLLYSLLVPMQSVSIGCEVLGIEYVKLENATCWSEEFSDNYCPMPTGIKCEGSAKYSLMTMLLFL